MALRLPEPAFMTLHSDLKFAARQLSRLAFARSREQSTRDEHFSACNFDLLGRRGLTLREYRKQVQIETARWKPVSRASNRVLHERSRGPYAPG